MSKLVLFVKLAAIILGKLNDALNYLLIRLLGKPVALTQLFSSVAAQDKNSKLAQTLFDTSECGTIRLANDKGGRTHVALSGVTLDRLQVTRKELGSAYSNAVFFYKKGYFERCLPVSLISDRRILKIIRKCQYFGIFCIYRHNGREIHGRQYEVCYHVYKPRPDIIDLENTTNPFLDKIAPGMFLSANDERLEPDKHFSSRLKSNAISQPIDLVYTWVDGDDPAWIEKRDQHQDTDTSSHSVDANCTHRYINRDELKYALRSVETYAAFIRHIYIVTDNQCPPWLDTNQPGVTLVDHKDIFKDESCLPTFNSHAIESQLHHIKGLSEHYIYCNDDFLFLNFTEPGDYYLRNGHGKVFNSNKVFIPLAETDTNNSAIDNAAINGQRILASEFGIWCRSKLKHAPYPQRKSIIEEIENKYPDVFRATMASRFRSITDLSVASSLAQHYGYYAGFSVASTISYNYLSTSDKLFWAKAKYIVNRGSARMPKCFCINDTGHHGTREEGKLTGDQAIVDLMEQLLPFKSRFEK
jgi:hypothetical protein